MTEGTVHERMAKVMAALNYIPKQRSSGVNYEFRGIDAVFNHLHHLLADQGLFLSPRVLDDWQVNQIPGTNNRTQTQALFRVCVDVYAADGSTVTLGPGLAQSHDYGDKAVYQAQQNAVKYILLEAFAIPTAEQDMDARHADPSPVVEPSPEEVSERLSNRLKVVAAEVCGGDTELAQLHFNAIVGDTKVTPETVAALEDAIRAASPFK